MADEHRLSRMETLWSVVKRAHCDDQEAVRAAREQLIQRYGNAVRKYLLGALQSENDANEVFQEFSLRMAEGRFQGADPNRGRFRNYIKTALFRLIVDFQRSRGKQALQPDIDNDVFGDDGQFDPEALFVKQWRSDLIERELLSADRKSWLTISL